jgi:hypothetical protein
MMVLLLQRVSAVGPQQTSRRAVPTSASGGKADVGWGRIELPLMTHLGHLTRPNKRERDFGERLGPQWC